MNYVDGQSVQLGDEVLIDGRSKGTIVACIDQGIYSNKYPESDWAYLKEGVLIDTDFGGLVHYRNLIEENIELVKRSFSS
ncbi:hypothetical protein EV696_1181 [Permianibacter aggregans]|uniref:Uncharacterized protein n=1 Tax=Permianibacter aggregans TaxID=1510150 RepID=A0A4R6UKM2_9GAMM|nr:hypothetical protein EV696_1181 [Permianibacter aggregans]